MELNLASLLNPLDKEDFLQNYWGNKAIVISSKSKEGFNSLFNWQKLNYLLNFHRLSYPDDIRFAKDGETLPPQPQKKWSSLLQQGTTLIINHIHELDPILAQLALNIRYELGHDVQINTYCTPSENKGFDCHYDTHEVIILQIDGEKEWFVLPPTIPSPISSQRTINDLPPDSLPYLKVILKPGDVLYIPRGHWHYAVSSGDRPSLHLTIGISCETGLDWLVWLTKKLQDSPLWRENLPLLPNGDSSKLQKQLQILAQELATELQKPSWREEYSKNLLIKQGSREGIKLPQQLGYDLFNKGLETRLWREKNQYFQIEKLSHNSLRVTIGSKQLDLQGEDLSVIRWILQQTEFSLLDLAEIAPNLDWDKVIEPLLTQLIIEGIYFTN
ncbi:myc induced nuclear antigen [Geminocystis sp. NIES-3708]|uniref:cupin domain-containing protein n=1 Tax=Geminocystis sp. NIES-3708 TaxID=1615909 RepID=UPI0005FC9760|nr:cupin domain-containing protein [Geminocystis sp. NIES-3708]BAQ62663.1 myc induced nuclear antigen [Geminocystis sp. NIES-3708]